MPQFAVIVTCNFVVRSRGQKDARERIEAELEEAIQEIAYRRWYEGSLPPEVEYYIERMDR